MRVTGNSFVNSLINQLHLLNARQYRLQNQAATGQRIQAPEDDPVGMARTLNLQKESSSVAQYEKTIASLQDRSTAAYNVLRQLKTISDRVGEIVTVANDGTKSAEDLKSYAQEVTHLINEAAQLMNSQYDNQYLFGGTASGHLLGATPSRQPPYELTADANGNVTQVRYLCNSTVIAHEVAEGSTITVDVPGANTSSTGPRGVITDSRSGADFFNHLISLQNHLLSGDVAAIVSNDQPALLNDENNIVYQVATNGAVQAQLEAQATIASNRRAALHSTISDVAGADLTETLVQLSQTQNAYQAALQTSSNILQLQQSLLSYL